jgi:squalene-associated FAD-dependent desaturase
VDRVEDLGTRLNGATKDSRAAFGSRAVAGSRVVSAAVVGAGWAGLAAAVTLAGRGVAVTVFEASRQLGGRARRVSIDGDDLDNGQHILIGAYRDTLSMMRAVGVDTEVALARLPLELRYADGFHLRTPRLPYPFNLLTGLLTAKGLPLREAWSALGMMRRLEQSAFRIDPDRPVAQYLAEQGQGDAACRYLWAPLCISALNTPLAIASAQVFASVLRDGLTGSREASDMLIPRIDLGQLFPDPAAGYVTRHGGTVRTGSAVRVLTRDEGGLLLELADGATERFDEVILACGPQHASALLGAFPTLAQTRRTIDALQYQPIVTCYLQYPDSVTLPSPMLGFQGGIVQWLFDRGRLGGRKGLLAVVVSASGAHEDLHREALADALESELRAAPVAALRTLPRRSAARVITEKRATFACTPNLLRPAMETGVPGLLLAGDYVAGDYPGTLEAAVRSGVAAAHAAAARLLQ